MRKYNPEKLYPITIDYGISIERIAELGNYYWWDKAITTKRFPTKFSGKSSIKIKLFRFHSPCLYQVRKFMENMEFRPAECVELLFFGKEYPRIQRDFGIVAPGTIYKEDEAGYVQVVALDGQWDYRRASIHTTTVHEKWGGLWRFAGVCE